MFRHAHSRFANFVFSFVFEFTVLYVLLYTLHTRYTHTFPEEERFYPFEIWIYQVLSNQYLLCCDLYLQFSVGLPCLVPFSSQLHSDLTVGSLLQEEPFRPKALIQFRRLIFLDMHCHFLHAVCALQLAGKSEANRNDTIAMGKQLGNVLASVLKVYMKRNFRQQFYCPP